MKKFLSLILALSVLACLGVQISFAANPNIAANEKIIETVQGENNTSASKGLIVTKSLSLSKTSTQLIISARTTGNEDVTKCGFTYIRLQRLINGQWVNYTTYCYTDQYNNSNNKTFSQYCSVPKGYTYRVICEHYAEKPRFIFWTTSETIYNQTSALAF